ncbi:hypothetical protein I602_230 [Polaribacter dokdonensis DSW-5]|uniref:Uncharacterized protein n=1 Tax=Polaribacter dokdonensis DSW-5 TaxID=1300348 RepID=A0A0N0CEP0_9FLAO|nr:hypothetical protein I602_230 [Polaribacter dokdonensis DSW-5]
MKAFPPTKEPTPTSTLPANTAPGPICAPLLIMHSCSIIAPVFMIQQSFITAKEFIDAFLLMKLPVPRQTSFETEADSCFTLIISKPLSLIKLKQSILNLLSPKPRAKENILFQPLKEGDFSNPRYLSL